MLTSCLIMTCLGILTHTFMIWRQTQNHCDATFCDWLILGMFTCVG